MFWTPEATFTEAYSLADEHDLKIGRLNSHQILSATHAMGGDPIAG
jgi:hypothetical protein